MIVFILGLLILVSVGIKLFPEYIVEVSLIVIGIELLCIGLSCIIKNDVKSIVRKYIIELQEELRKG